ncbi:carbohydrate kinase family protein [Crenobacter intestini]|uniref:Carbohydrate kinase family protein n=1 Tax=Crenobacter intestini TaxID=2563443 RepID=A0A4T0V3H6_9NEIS|nr:carbohydrate kinase family protein [Crenobacter intestini]TIC86188.1 carbohydrate kinase family protein [Crenobacter intestini]
MAILVCGAIAYDTLFSFEDRFDSQILPDQLHKISTTFLAPTMRREFGGPAGNIAYSLAMLGEKPILMGAVGEDFAPYRQHLKHFGVDDRFVKVIPGQYTPQCFGIADRDGNQLMAFHPGAMNYGDSNHIADVPDAVDVAILSPGGRAAFLQHSRELHAAGIPFVFDPGQELPLLSADEIREIVEMASYLAINDYESELIRERAGLTLDMLRAQVKALIVTRGSKGAEIYADDSVHLIPRVQMDAPPIDPMGCGDAFRAGLLYGIRHGLDWRVTGRLANVIGAIKVTSNGPQNHFFDWGRLSELYLASYGEALPLPQGMAGA